ncbi:hypothetical protein A9264_13975 [Vibrio sp. UCD-FRSSP16_10]|uniref:ABC transporter substrate-binding protein n=1 Tax=unclassified Vibrio TaxID=2614977 RepID=UPI0007FE6247|nr:MULTISPECIES: ABC transporter substrate-binding protein [unclassified Vibrio]OBT13520.1 hypothetical protein A9260_14355 [Vibrio sp. UCD-FRSSP16_30]OBT19979.1 hypothetical protein A9264_13975 [Vibrio sp. UCD-FRSSP16_10]
MKNIGSLLRALSVFGLFFSAFAWAQFPLTVTDAGGTTITLSAAPQKISSKTLFSDEVLLDLIEPQRFTSVTNLVDDKQFSPIVGKVPKSVPRLDLNVERILINQPDIVFAASWTDAGRVEQLRSSGIKVFLLPIPTTLDGIKDTIKLVGKIVGEDNNAKSIVIDMEHRLQEGLILTRHKFKLLDYNNWGTSSTKNSTWQLIVKQAGFVNLVEDLDADKYGQTPMSKELLISLNPDVMFIPGWLDNEQQGDSKLLQQVMTDPALRQVKAVKQGCVYPIPEALRSTYSQYIVDTILYVNQSVLGAPAP